MKVENSKNSQNIEMKSRYLFVRVDWARMKEDLWKMGFRDWELGNGRFRSFPTYQTALEKQFDPSGVVDLWGAVCCYRPATPPESGHRARSWKFLRKLPV